MNSFHNILFVLFLCFCVVAEHASVQDDFDSFEMFVQDLNMEDLDAFGMVVVDFDPYVHDVAGCLIYKSGAFNY